MSKLITYTNLGQITGSKTGPNWSLEAYAKDCDGNCLIVDSEVAYDTHYVDVATKSVRPMPERPSDRHEFNYAAKEWRLNEPKLRAAAIRELRSLRNELLAGCDWTQVPDAPVDAEAWRVYRQQLRDLPEQYPDILSIDEVVWPNPPS
jgi:hypothetical protein